MSIRGFHASGNIPAVTNETIAVPKNVKVEVVIATQVTAAFGAYFDNGGIYGHFGSELAYDVKIGNDYVYKLNGHGSIRFNNNHATETLIYTIIGSQSV